MKAYYELQEAIQLAAKQNMERDILVGIADADEELQDWLEEAEWLLVNTGENYIPEDSSQEHICVK